MDSVKRFRDRQTMAVGAAERFVELATQSIQLRGQFNVALAGGSTPRQMYELLASTYRNGVDWERVHFFWGDERTVPADHPDSNYHMARTAMLDHLAVPDENVHPIMADGEPDEAARAYAVTLQSHFNDVAVPRFDLILLGMGTDGHTASLFPHTDALEIRNGLVVANYVSEKDSWRITLTIPVINAAAHVIFLVSGQSKAEALKEVLTGARRPLDYPAQFIAPENGEIIWFVDEDAAAYV